MSNDLAAISAVKEPHIGHYESLNTIGQENFTRVRLAWHILIRREVAVKIINWWGSSRLFQKVQCGGLECPKYHKVI